MEKIFVDSNFFIAEYNLDDSLHLKAVLKRKEIQKTDTYLLTSNLIFLETVTVLSQRAGKKVAISWGKHILENQQIEIIQVDLQLQNLTWEIFQKIKKKNMSFVDCSSLAILETYDIKRFLTFDTEDFGGLEKTYGFKII